MNKIIHTTFLVLFLFGCKENVESPKLTKNVEKPIKEEQKEPNDDKNPTNSLKSDFCWKGKIQNKIPVFIHFQIEDSVVLGEIMYLNTKQKLPIKLIGQQMNGGLLRIQEFEKSGNVSGIITGMMHGKEFKGEWFSPTSRKDLPISLLKYDTLIPSISMTATNADCYGDYFYQYSTEGSQGGFSLTKTNNKGAFEISCVTRAPARNLAYLEEKEVILENNEIIYNIPEEETCNFKVKFYNGFAIINYTNGECAMGYFGHNAHVDGIFLKTK